MQSLRAFGSAYLCMVIHRDMQMVHVEGGDHEVLCKTCKRKTGSLENQILTSWYFNRPLYMVPLLLIATPVAFVHEKLTGRVGTFEYPSSPKAS